MVTCFGHLDMLTVTKLMDSSGSIEGFCPLDPRPPRVRREEDKRRVWLN